MPDHQHRFNMGCPAAYGKSRWGAISFQFLSSGELAVFKTGIARSCLSAHGLSTWRFSWLFEFCKFLAYENQVVFSAPPLACQAPSGRAQSWHLCEVHYAIVRQTKKHPKPRDPRCFFRADGGNIFPQRAVSFLPQTPRCVSCGWRVVAPQRLLLQTRSAWSS